MTHVLQLYQEEACLLETLAEYVAEGLRLDEAIIVIGTKPRWDLLLDRLRQNGVDAHARAARGQMRLIGVHVVLAACLPGGQLARPQFNRLLGGALEFARMRYERVRVVSELTDARWREGDRSGACALERLWKPLLGVHDFKLLCACPIDTLEGECYDGTLQALCHAHTHVSPARDESGFEDAVSVA